MTVTFINQVTVSFNFEYDMEMLKKLRERDVKLSRKSVEAIHFYSSVFGMLVVVFFLVRSYWNLIALRMDFYNNLWGPAYLLIHNQSPYDTASLHPILSALWYPMAVGFFFALGLLEETIATKAWFLLNLAELFAIIMFTTRDKRKFYLTIIVGFLVYFFPPTLNHFVLGQFSITAMLLLLASVYFAEKKQDWLSAFCLALGISKPQLGILAIIGLSSLYFQRGGFKSLAGYWLKILLMALIMSLPLFISYPDWIPDWIKSTQSNYTWLQPSLYSTLKHTLGLWGFFFWISITIAGVILCFQLWKKSPPQIAMLWSLGLTTIISPYLWSWDYVLLLPIWMYIFTQIDWTEKIILLVVYIIGWVGIAFIQRLENSSNDMFWWIPLWYMLSITLVTRWKTGGLKGDIYQFTD